MDPSPHATAPLVVLAGVAAPWRLRGDFSGSVVAQSVLKAIVICLCIDCTGRVIGETVKEDLVRRS